MNKKKIAIIGGIAALVVAAIIIAIVVMGQSNKPMNTDVKTIDPNIKVTLYYNGEEVPDAAYVRNNQVMVNTSKIESINNGEMPLSDIEAMSDKYKVAVQTLSDGMKVSISDKNSSATLPAGGEEIIGTYEENTISLTTSGSETDPDLTGEQTEPEITVDTVIDDDPIETEAPIVTAETEKDVTEEPIVTESPVPEWTETEVNKTMYVTEKCSVRVRPIQGSAKVDTLNRGDKVTVVAKTDTDYYKLGDGRYVHKDFLSDKKPSETTTTEKTTKAEETTAEEPPVNSETEKLAGVLVLDATDKVNLIWSSINERYIFPAFYKTTIYGQRFSHPDLVYDESKTPQENIKYFCDKVGEITGQKSDYDASIKGFEYPENVFYCKEENGKWHIRETFSRNNFLGYQDGSSVSGLEGANNFIQTMAFLGGDEFGDNLWCILDEYQYVRTDNDKPIDDKILNKYGFTLVKQGKVNYDDYASGCTFVRNAVWKFKDGREITITYQRKHPASSGIIDVTMDI